MDNQLLTIIIFLAGAGLGAAVGWFLLRTKASSASAADLATLKERLDGKESEVQRLQAASVTRWPNTNSAREDVAQLKAALEGERRAASERIASFKNASEELSEKFTALSRDALKDNNQSFLELAHSTLQKFQQTAKGDLELKAKSDRRNWSDRCASRWKKLMARLAKWKRRAPALIPSCANR